MRLAVLAVASLAAFAVQSTGFAAEPPAQPASAASAPTQEARDDAEDQARWMYSALTGEIAARTGHPAVAYAELLRAARDTHSGALFERAIQVAVAAGAQDQALAAAGAWCVAEPDSARAQLWSAQLNLAAGRDADAGAALGRLLALAPESKRGQWIGQLDQLLADARTPARALEVGKRVVAPYRALPQSDALLAQLLQRSGDRAKAFAHASRALRGAPDERGAVGVVLQNYDLDPQGADELVAAYLNGAEDDDAVRLAWAEVAVQQQRSSVALRACEALTRRQPQVPQPWLIQGSLQLQLGRVREAQTSLLTFLSLADDVKFRASGQALAQAYLGLSEAALQQGDLPQAQRWLDQVPPLQEQLVTAVQQATILGREGKLHAALAAVEALPHANPTQARDRVLAQAQVWTSLKEPAKAYAVLHRGLSRYGSDADFTYQTALAADKAGHPEASVRLLRRALAANPDSQGLNNALGYTLTEAGHDLPEALRLITRALKLAPGNPFVLDSMGWVQFRLGYSEKAEHYLEQAWSAREEPAIAAHLGQVLWQRGDRERARDMLHRAWLAAPDDPAVREALRDVGLKF